MSEINQFNLHHLRSLPCRSVGSARGGLWVLPVLRAGVPGAGLWPRLWPVQLPVRLHRPQVQHLSGWWRRAARGLRQPTGTVSMLVSFQHISGHDSLYRPEKRLELKSSLNFKYLHVKYLQWINVCIRCKKLKICTDLYQFSDFLDIFKPKESFFVQKSHARCCTLLKKYCFWCQSPKRLGIFEKFQRQAFHEINPITNKN